MFLAKLFLDGKAKSGTRRVLQIVSRSADAKEPSRKRNRLNYATGLLVNMKHFKLLDGKVLHPVLFHRTVRGVILLLPEHRMMGSNSLCTTFVIDQRNMEQESIHLPENPFGLSLIAGVWALESQNGR